jgi:gamma-carbonic anhydrase
MIILPYKNKIPNIDKNAFIASTANIIGDVTIGEYSNIWFNTVIRGDVAKIVIGKNTNIQDSTVIHVGSDGGDTIIGDNVTIGHKCLIHAANLHDNCFIGMGAIIMDGAIIEEGAWVAAGALVTNNKIVKSGQIWAGSPAKYFRDLTAAESKHILESAQNYVTLSKDYK